MIYSHDLGPAELRIIAGAAGGLDMGTVEDYLAGRRKQQHRTVVAIERALRETGREDLIRPRRTKRAA